MNGDHIRAAVIDIGTNTARLLAVGGGPTVRRSEVCALGRDVDRTGRLAADAIERTLAVLSGYRSEFREADVRRIVATSASRDAVNRDTFFDAVEELLGSRPELISGEEEAGHSFRGATATADSPGPYLVIDIGGGSTELVYGTTRPEYLISTQIGSVRLTDRLLGERPVPPSVLDAAARHVASVLDAVRLPARPATVLGVAGTFTSLALLARDVPYRHVERAHGTVMTTDEVYGLVELLASLTFEQTASHPAIDPKRAPVLLGGAVVAHASLTHVGAEEVEVSGHDLLEGVAASLLAQ